MEPRPTLTKLAKVNSAQYHEFTTTLFSEEGDILSEPVIEVHSVDKFLNEIFKVPPAKCVTRCFRGQKNVDWPVKPSVFRKTSENAESKMLSDLFLETPGDFYEDRTMFEKLVRAQHYELPTRILDVSLNPLVALFFSTENHIGDDGMPKNGVLYIFDVEEDRTKNADSDIISLISNLSRLSDKDLDDLKKNSKNCRSDKQKEEFRKTPACEKLCQFVRMEKPYFLNHVDPLDLRRYYLALPYKANRRIIAQSGAFIVAGCLEYTGLNRSRNFSKTTKIVIPHDKKEEIRAHLDQLNINTKSLFPEIVSAARDISKRYL